MSARHFLQGEEQERAQKAQVEPLPIVFSDNERQFSQAWRSDHAVIYLRSALSDEQNHLYFLWRVVREPGNRERCSDLIKVDRSFNLCLTLAGKLEPQ